MPMLDAYIPEGALTAEAEDRLLAELTDLLITHEGADPTNPLVRSIAWVFLHRPAAVYAAGAREVEPHYRFIASVPEGQFDAEAGAYERDPMRVWVFTPEIPEGTWGGAGRVITLADIATFATGDPELGRRYAEQRLADRRGNAAVV